MLRQVVLVLLLIWVLFRPQVDCMFQEVGQARHICWIIKVPSLHVDTGCRKHCICILNQQCPDTICQPAIQIVLMQVAWVLHSAESDVLHTPDMLVQLVV